MPSISFQGASNFAITGGNFNDVQGDVITHNYPSPFQGLPPNALADLSSRSALQAPEHSLSRRERKRLAERRRMETPLPTARIQQAPSSVAPTTPIMSPATPSPSHYSPSERSTASIPPASPNRYAFTSSPLSESSLDLGSEGYNTASPRSSRHSTPPTDMDEHQNLGRSDVPATNPASDIDLLTPLTNSLGLSRFTPAAAPQALPNSHEERVAPNHAPVQPLSSVAESPAEFGLELRRSPSNPPPPPPASTRPVFQPSRFSPTVPEQFEQERRNPLGPPPPVPPRPGMLSPAWTTAPVDTPFPTSRPMSVLPATPSQVPRFGALLEEATSPVAGQAAELEDPGLRFARLQAQRSSTKGYASGLNQSPTTTPRYSPSMPGALSSPPPPPPPPPATRPTSLPMSSASAVSPNPNPNQARSPIHEIAAPHATRWTPDSINGWAGGVDGRGLGSLDGLSSGDSTSVRPPISPTHPASHRYGEQHYHQQPTTQQHYPNVGQGSNNMQWGNNNYHPNPASFGYNQVPNPAFPQFGYGSAPAFAVPPFGAPFHGPAFGGPAFNGGFPF